VAPVASADDGWTDLGFALAGTHGDPLLEGSGHLVPGTPMTLTLSNVRAETTTFAVVGLSAIYLPFSGGTFVPAPTFIFNFPTGGTAGSPSTLNLQGKLPGTIPIGTEIYSQFWTLDPVSPQGFSASNGLLGTVREFYTVIASQLDGLLEDAVGPNRSKPVYSSQDFTNLVWVRNSNCWAASIDLTGMSPWNQSGGRTRAGTLISPRHIAFAEHYRLSTSPGSNQLVFVTADNQTITRHLIAASYPIGDIGIGLLDQDVPPEISFHKVLPTNWADSIERVNRLPMLHLDQEEKALVRDMGALASNCTHKDAISTLRAPFTETLIGGDSGNPAFLLIGGEAILILTHFSAVHGPHYGYWVDEVNTAMTTLGGGYQLTTFDLEGYLQN